MTWPPAASMRSAAAITSITMNGGTSLRPDAVDRPFPRSLSVASSIDICYLSWCPRLAAFGGLLGHIAYLTGRQSQRLLDAAPHGVTQENIEVDCDFRRDRACPRAVSTGARKRKGPGEPP